MSNLKNSFEHPYINWFVKWLNFKHKHGESDWQFIVLTSVYLLVVLLNNKIEIVSGVATAKYQKLFEPRYDSNKWQRSKFCTCSILTFIFG